MATQKQITANREKRQAVHRPSHRARQARLPHERPQTRHRRPRRDLLRRKPPRTPRTRLRVQSRIPARRRPHRLQDQGRQRVKPFGAGFTQNIEANNRLHRHMADTEQGLLPLPRETRAPPGRPPAPRRRGGCLRDPFDPKRKTPKLVRNWVRFARAPKSDRKSRPEMPAQDQPGTP